MGRSDRAERAAGLARAAVDWLLNSPGPDCADPSLYHGRAGVLLAVDEARAFFDDPGYAAAVDRGADALTAGIDGIVDSSLYFGLSGVAFALRGLGRKDAAREALRRVAARREGGRCSNCCRAMPGSVSPR